MRWLEFRTPSSGRAASRSNRCTTPNATGRSTITSWGFRSSSRGHNRLDWKRLFPKRTPAEGARLTPELRARIQASFDEASQNDEHFPSTIDPRIYHVKLIRQHLGDLRGKRVLDVGCGKGRFARVFREQEPEVEIWGLDISEEMLRYVPEGIHTKAGSMTEL